MNLQHLRHFIVVAKHGNLLRASGELNISQSGLSRSISVLEENLGLALFERRTRGVELTDFGQRFLPRAQSMIHEYARAVEDIDAYRNHKTGKINIGINRAFVYFLADEVLRDIIAQSPDIEVSVVTDNYKSLTERLKASEFDVVLSLYLDNEKSEELVYEDLFPFESAIFSNRSHPLTKKKKASADELAQCRWALIDGKGARESFYDYFRTHGLPEPKVTLNCTSATLLLSIISHLELVTTLPRPLAQLEIKKGRPIAEIRTEGFYGNARCGLIYKTDTIQTPIALQICGAFQNSAAQIRKAMAK